MRFLSAILLTMPLLLGGCYSINTVETANPSAQRAVIADKRVVWDNTLNGKLGVGQIIDTTGSKGLKSIQVDVTNQYAYAMNFAYKIEWFGRDGAKLESPVGGWKTLHLEAHESSTISEIAIDPKAADFVIKFQEGKGSNTIF